VNHAQRVRRARHAEAIEEHVQAVELLLPRQIARALGRGARLAGDGRLERRERRLVLILREGRRRKGA
jgi:hypothetical protein